MKASIELMKTGALMLFVTAVLWSLGGLWVGFIEWNPAAIAGRSLIAFLAIAAVMPVLCVRLQAVVGT